MTIGNFGSLVTFKFIRSSFSKAPPQSSEYFSVEIWDVKKERLYFTIFIETNSFVKFNVFFENERSIVMF